MNHSLWHILHKSTGIKLNALTKKFINRVLHNSLVLGRSGSIAVGF